MSNEIDVFMSTASFREEDVRDKTVVVIDVMRACSTMVTALDNGAKNIIPVEDMDEANRISQNLDDSQYLLCGEKDGVKIEGYHLGNSPLEYTREVVEEKTIILNSTNGTKAVKKASVAGELIVGSFLNLTEVVEALKTAEHNIALICAGWHGRLSLEDTIYAGNIIYDLYDGRLPDSASDSASIAFELYKKFGDDIETTFKQSDHAQRLKGIISLDDIEHCCRKDSTDALPVLREGIITNDNGKKT